MAGHCLPAATRALAFGLVGVTRNLHQAQVRALKAAGTWEQMGPASTQWRRIGVRVAAPRWDVGLWHISTRGEPPTPGPWSDGCSCVCRSMPCLVVRHGLGPYRCRILQESSVTWPRCLSLGPTGQRKESFLDGRKTPSIGNGPGPMKPIAAAPLRMRSIAT